MLPVVKLSSKSETRYARLAQSFPQRAEELFAKGVCLPSDTKMTPQQQERVIRLIRGLL